MLFLLVSVNLNAHAQEAGQLSGTITDNSGTAIPSAIISVRNVGTNAIRSTTANSSGGYTFTNLSPAVYEVAVPPVAGFGAYKANAEVTVGGKITLDIKLSVNSSNTTIEVSAESSAQVNTQSQELSQVISQEQVSQLPSLTRNPYDFVQISGNISSGDAGSNNQAQNASTRGVGFGLNGGRSTGTEILLDGVENISVFGDAVGIVVPIDSVQEFRVITSNFEPQYGRASGGVVNVATKSGVNQFHGSAYDFNRLSAYTANTVYNAQSGIAKGKYTRNQFGGTLGGPIVKDKLFFFGDAEFIRVRSAANSVSLIPTTQFLAQAPANVSSFFSTYGTNAPSSTNVVLNSQLGSNAYANLPANFPVFQKIAFTTPTNAGGGIPQNTYNVVGRVDYNLGSSTQAFFRYVNYNEVDQSGGVFASPYKQYNVGGANKAQAYLLSIAHEFSPKLTTITKGSFSRFNTSNTYSTALQNVPTLFLSANAQIAGTNVQFPGFYDNNPANGGLPYGGPQNTIQVN